MKLEVFEPPMCCSSGVCGPKVEPALVQFTADLDWLRRQGVSVTRFNLAQQPMAFAENPAVSAALTADELCLPLTLIDGKVVCGGRYPLRWELAGFAGIEIAKAVSAVPASGGCCCDTGVTSKRTKCCG